MVGCLGPEGSFSYEVALSYEVAQCSGCRNRNIIKTFKNIPSMMECFFKGSINEVIIPFENSIEGVVTPVIDAMIINMDKEFSIQAEYVLNIQQNLIGIGEANEIEKIISHPHALAQCQSLIQKLDAKTEPCSSTSEAVRIIKEKKSKKIAALGSKSAADLYGVKIIAPNVQDRTDNKTRFLALKQGNNVMPNFISKRDKASIILGLENKPGALVDVLSVFKEYGLNMTFIMSRPSKINPWEYNFFLDLDCNGKIQSIKEAILKTRERTNFLKVLGFYDSYFI